MAIFHRYLDITRGESPYCHRQFDPCSIMAMAPQVQQVHSEREEKSTPKNHPNSCVTFWLVVSNPLKNISQLGLLFHIPGKLKKCSKPPTSYFGGKHLYIHSWRKTSQTWRKKMFFTVYTFLTSWKKTCATLW